MTSTSKKSIRTYLKTIRKKLPCSISIRTAIIQDLKQTILANEACQEWTFDKLQEEFGTPDEIAVGFSNGSLNDHLRKKVRHIRIAFIISAVLFILLISFLLCVLADVFSSNSTDVTITNYGVHSK